MSGRVSLINSQRRIYDPIKRLVDVVGALTLLLCTAPIQAIFAVLVLLKLGRPVLFRQNRPGRNGKTFTILKFRTMLNIDPELGKVTNEQRTHPFGEFLRATSIDELPSLWNVLRGDMSLVGPRPLRTTYMDRYSDAQARRHLVRPGMTGLAQISGRNSLSWDERLELDQRYVEQRGPLLDLRIMLTTLGRILRRDGIAAEGHATMSEFFGPEHTERLTLVDLTTEHLQTRVEWLKAPEVQEGISLSFDPQLEPTKRWFERVRDDLTRSDWVAVDRAGGPCAMCGITGITEDRAELYIYVNPRLLGQGYGRETMQLLMAKARQRGIRYLNLQTKMQNERSRRLYESLGFKPSVNQSVDADMIAMTTVLRADNVDGS